MIEKPGTTNIIVNKPLVTHKVCLNIRTGLFSNTLEKVAIYKIFIRWFKRLNVTPHKLLINELLN